MQGEKVEAQAKVAALEQERAEADAQIEHAQAMYERSVEKNARLREAIEGMPCYCIRSGSADGTTTVMQKCRRCRALTEGENDD
jgi:hypothetical protein